MTADDHDMRFRWEDDGLTLVLTARMPGGTLTQTVKWRTKAEADANHRKAMRDFMDRIRDGEHTVVIGERLTVRRVVTRWGTFYPRLDIGPPTWWLPKARVDWKDDGFGAGLGWLRAAAYVHFNRNNRKASS